MLEPAGFASTLLTIPLYPLKADATRGEAISIAPTDCWRLSRPKWPLMTQGAYNPDRRRPPPSLTQLFAQLLSSYHCEFPSVLL
jgi:hypothetical protein